MRPNFIGIGAQKSGTTWLHRNLQAHPQIHMPRKEIHYFDQKINERSNLMKRVFGKRESDAQWRRQVKHLAVKHTIKQPSLRGLIQDTKYYMRPYDDRWYASIFEPEKGGISGEITPAYSAIGRKKIAHAYRLAPDAKIIFFMRNPIERVWSHAVMSFDTVEKGSVRFASEEELLRRVERDSAWVLSNYRRTLENWCSFYEEEQVFLGFLEDVYFFPEELLGRLYEFLGVDAFFDDTLTGKKVHSRSADTMPAMIAVHLARNYHEEITWLHERFGGYASFWLYCAERLVDDPPTEEYLSYPLWTSHLWAEWVGDLREPRLTQSGPLASIRVTR